MAWCSLLPKGNAGLGRCPLEQHRCGPQALGRAVEPCAPVSGCSWTRAQPWPVAITRKRLLVLLTPSSASFRDGDITGTARWMLSMYSSFRATWTVPSGGARTPSVTAQYVAVGLWALLEWVKNFCRRLVVWGQLERSTSPEASFPGAWTTCSSRSWSPRDWLSCGSTDSNVSSPGFPVTGRPCGLFSVIRGPC